VSQVTAYRRETIVKASLPAYGYMGSAVALMHKGKEVIVMAADTDTLLQVVRDIRPSLEIDPKAIYSVCLMHDRHVTTEQEEEL
jgi:hypothetical protein